MEIVHGGDIYRNRIRLDFSVNTNPLGCPETVRQALRDAADRVEVYPDPARMRVRAEIARLYGVKAENVLAGNGASELIMAVTRAISPGRVLLTAPSFYGYERAAQSVPGCEIRWHQLKQEEGFAVTERFLEELTDDTDLCWLCNPNNPTGAGVEPGLLRRIIERCEERGIDLVVDECFTELAEQATTVIPLIREYRRLHVLKAYTKLLAVPGVRFGFLISAEENVERIEAFLPEWNLSVFAEAAAIAGSKELQKGDYLRKAKALIGEERRYLTSELEKLSVRVIPGQANYLFLQTDRELFRPLLERGILIRDCANYHGLERGYYRVAVRDHEVNEELIRTMREVLH